MGVNILQNTSCLRIIQGKEYFCSVGSGIHLYRKKDQKKLGSLRGMRYVSSAKFAEDKQLVVKTTQGFYYRWNIEDQSCTAVYKNKRIDSVGQDTLFSIDVENNVIYDLVHDRNFQYYSLRLDMRTGEFILHSLPYQGSVFRWTAFEDSFMFIQNRHPSAYEPELLLQNDQSFDTESLASKPSDRIAFFCADYIIFRSNEIFWIKSKQRMQLNVPDSAETLKHAVFINQKNWLVLAYTNCVYLLDIEKNEVMFSYPEKNITAAQIMGNRLYIGTLQKLLCIDDFVST